MIEKKAGPDTQQLQSREKAVVIYGILSIVHGVFVGSGFSIISLPLILAFNESRDLSVPVRNSVEKGVAVLLLCLVSMVGVSIVSGIGAILTKRQRWVKCGQNALFGLVVLSLLGGSLLVVFQGFASDVIYMSGVVCVLAFVCTCPLSIVQWWLLKKA